MRAVECADFLESLAEDLPPERENAFRQVTALRGKLFADDLRMASILDGTVDSGSPAETLRKVAGTSGQVDLSSFLRTEPADPAEENPMTAMERLVAHYQTRLESSNVDYAQVAKVLDSVVSSPEEYLETDLLKDAWNYVALRTETLTWWEEQHTHLATPLAE